MKGIRITDDGFEAREYCIESMKWDEGFESDKHSQIVVMFDRSMEYSVEDIFGVDNYEIADDGRLKVTFHMGVNEWLYGFLLGFGDKIEVLEPAGLREKIKNIAESVCKVYEKT